MTCLDDREFTEASELLSEFVVERAESLRQELGFGWIELASAPGDFDAVLDAYFVSCESGRSFPVGLDGSETTLYSSPAVNSAFRFWHDMTHVRLHCSFDYWDERAVAEFQLGQLEASGVSRGSLLWLLLRADTIGQNEFSRLSGGGFVSDQRAFAYAAVEHGLGIALLQELALTPPPKTSLPILRAVAA